MTHSDPIEQLRIAIANHETNQRFARNGYEPLFAASPSAKIVIIGQAPGIRAQNSGKPWDDASGNTLISWLGVSQQQFSDERIFAHMPMDFYYPGKGSSGDLPPRDSFAPAWHPQLLNIMPKVQLTVLVGRYAQRYYLPESKHLTLTEIVYNFEHYLPHYFPIVHPSPLNFRWHAKNPWFEKETIPLLRQRINSILEATNNGS